MTHTPAAPAATAPEATSAAVAAPEVPLIYTTLGNVPVASLQHHIKWDNTPEYIKFTEIYSTPGGMVVKESAHVFAKQGQAMGAEQAGLA